MCAKRVVTLSIESGAIRLLSLKGQRVEKWGSVAIEPGVIRDGLVLKPELLAASVGALFEEVGLPKKDVIVDLAGMQSFFRVLNLPKMKTSLLDEAVRRAAWREIPVPFDELNLVWQPVGRAGQKTQRIFVLAAPKAVVKTEREALAQCSLRPMVMESKSLALIRAVNQKRVIIVHLDPGSFSIILVAEGLPNIVRTIVPRGGDATLEDNVYRLLGELLRTVEFYNREHLESNLPLDTPVYLTGELAENEVVADIICSQMSYPINLFVPSLKYKPGFSPAAYAVNIGLALRAVPRKKVEDGARNLRLNILAMRRKPKTVPTGHVLLWLVVLLLAGSLYPSYNGLQSAGDDTDALRDELRAVEREFKIAQIVLGEAAKVNKIAAEADALEQIHYGILSLDEKNAESIRAILEDLPAAAVVSTIQTEPEVITIEGDCTDPSSIVAYAKTLEKSGRFDPVSITELEEKRFVISLGR